MYSIQDFSTKIKQKYPQYQNIDDVTLTKTILEKHPEYQGKVDLQPLANYEGMRRSLFGALPGGDVGAGIAQNEIKSAMNLAQILNNPQISAQRGVEKLLGLQPAVDIKERAYDENRKALTTAQNSDQAIGQTIGSIGEYFIPASTVNKLSTGAGKFSKLMGLSDKGSKLVTAGAGLIGDAAASTGVNSVQERKMPDLNGFLGNLALGAGTQLVGKMVKGVGKGFMNQLLGATKNEKAILEKKGMDVYGSLADDIGLSFTKKGMSNKAGNSIKKYTPIRTDILSKLDDSGITVKPQDLMKRLSPDDIANELDDIIGKTTFTGKKKVLTDIDSEIKYIKKVIGNKPLTPSKVHELKQMFDKPVNWDKLNPADKATVAVNKVVADNARSILDKISSGGVTKINAKIAPLANIQKLMKKGEYSKTLGDIISGSSGFGGGGIKGAVTGIAAQRALRNPAIQSLLGVSNYKLGSFLQSPIGRKLLLGTGNTLVNDK